MKIAISQPRYLPALNYLQRISVSDKFVLLDDVQHQSRAFEHRNKLRDHNKAQWLSIPIDRTLTSKPLIKDMKIADPKWTEDHKNRLQAYYRGTPFFNGELLDDLYKDLDNEEYFIDVAEKQLLRIIDFLNIPGSNKLVRSSEFGLKQVGSSLLASLTNTLEGNVYISGLNGRNYIDKDDFKDIEVVYHEFTFPRYEQQNNPFIPWLGWIDCLFNAGIEKTSSFISRNAKLYRK